MLGVPNAGSEEAKIPVWRWVPKIDGPDQRGFDAAYRWMLMRAGWVWDHGPFRRITPSTLLIHTSVHGPVPWEHFPWPAEQ